MHPAIVACSARMVFGIAFVFSLLVSDGPAFAAGGGKVANPDFTKGESIPDGANHDWNLGVTGARGWMYSERLTTLKARQIAITSVAQGSPADGVLAVGDVVLGVGGKAFSVDAREEFARALTAAESNAGKGELVLTRWRDGQSQEVTLKLAVLGDYSPTAPYDCAKSKRIYEQGCAALVKTMTAERYNPNPMVRSMNALALLASGDERYHKLLKREAQWAAGYKAGGFATWWYGYALMFMSEYVMATGDTSIMPGLTRMALEAAEGQSIVGSWGHRFARPNGLLMGYGMMNAPGVPLTSALVLAREAGVDDPKVDLAIERSVRLIRFYVDKGSIPYGDHKPWTQTHEDNGKNGMAAVLFNLLGDKPAATYFSRMALASHGNERDTGHTGNIWNISWAMPGINPSGPNATGAWMTQFGGWYFDLARQWDGTHRHQGPPQAKTDKTRGWDTTGANLLVYAMPLKQLRITGKGRQAPPRLSMAEARGVVAMGIGWNNLDRNSFYDALSTQVLLDRLGSWSPIVRERAGMALGRRKAQVQPQLIELLRSDNRYARYGACKAFKFVKGDNAAAVPELMQAFDSDDKWLRMLAADALAGIGEQAKPAVPAMLKRLANSDTEGDPRQMEQRYLTFSLFARRGGLLSRSIEGVDRALLVEAVATGLQNQDGRARGNLASVYDKLTLEEIRPLLPLIRDTVAESAPSGIMFASGIRNEGLRLLAKHNVEEGMQVGVDYLNATWNQWGASRRTPTILKHLAAYGANAQAIVPQLEALAITIETTKGVPASHMKALPILKETIQKIKGSKHKPEMIRIEGPRVGAAPGS